MVPPSTGMRLARGRQQVLFLRPAVGNRNRKFVNATMHRVDGFAQPQSASFKVRIATFSGDELPTTNYLPPTFHGILDRHRRSHSDPPDLRPATEHAAWLGGPAML